MDIQLLLYYSVHDSCSTKSIEYNITLKIYLENTGCAKKKERHFKHTYKI